MTDKLPEEVERALLGLVAYADRRELDLELDDGYQQARESIAAALSEARLDVMKAYTEVLQGHGLYITELEAALSKEREARDQTTEALILVGDVLGDIPGHSGPFIKKHAIPCGPLGPWAFLDYCPINHARKAIAAILGEREDSDGE